MVLNLPLLIKTEESTGLKVELLLLLVAASVSCCGDYVGGSFLRGSEVVSQFLPGR